DMKVFPGGQEYLMRHLTNLSRQLEIIVNPLDDLDVKINKVLKTLKTQQLYWEPTKIDLPDKNGNVPLIQAIIDQNEKKALRLLNAGANTVNVHGPMKNGKT